MEQQTSTPINAAGFSAIRTDAARAVAFYTQRLGFTLKHQQLPAFASASFWATLLSERSATNVNARNARREICACRPGSASSRVR